MAKINTITQDIVDKIYDESEKLTYISFRKCLILSCKLKNGFVITESSACVDPKNFDATIGVQICKERIKNKIWELEGYRLQNNICETKGGV